MNGCLIRVIRSQDATRQCDVMCSHRCRCRIPSGCFDGCRCSRVSLLLELICQIGNREGEMIGRDDRWAAAPTRFVASLEKTASIVIDRFSPAGAYYWFPVSFLTPLSFGLLSQAADHFSLLPNLLPDALLLPSRLPDSIPKVLPAIRSANG
jgi:hypothetical protein